MRSDRHKQVLQIILDQLTQYKEVESIYLYGSCSRSREKYNSDVDLFVTLNIPYDAKYSRLIREMRTLEKPYSLPDVDYNFLFSEYRFDDIKDFKNSYYKDVHREAILLWTKQDGYTESYIMMKEK